MWLLASLLVHSKVSVLASAARLGKSFMDNLVKNNNLLLFLLIMSTKIFPNCWLSRLLGAKFDRRGSASAVACLRCSTYRSPRQPFGSRFNR
jgi:hypothetical protein